MFRPLFAYCLFTVVFVAGSTSLLADDPRPGDAAKTSDSRPVAERIAELAQPLIDAEVIVGMSIGVIHDGRRETFGFGKLARDRDDVPNGQTVFEIGSITKAFTSIALAEMAEAGIVKLDDPAQSLLPAGTTLAQFGDKPITLAHLASHLSPGQPDAGRRAKSICRLRRAPVTRVSQFLEARTRAGRDVRIQQPWSGTPGISARPQGRRVV
jgi:CubicO group peptidase (beta-lactamase class C family)